jgi:hypothetical protein
MTRKTAFALAGLALCGMSLPLGLGTALAAGNGPLNTPLAAFTDGKTGKIIWLVPGVIKHTNMSTDFLCTSLEAPGVNIDIGVEVFDLDGTQLNALDGSIAIASSTCPTGSVLGVPPGSTVTIGLTGTAQLHEDCKIGFGAVAQGSARIVSTSSKISCDALALDDKHAVADPAVCNTCPPPTVTSLKVIKPKKQSGD